jgi:CBS domain-containing protein
MDLAKNLKIESVSRLQPSPALQVGPSCTVAEVVELLRRHEVGCVLVCRDGKLIGIFTERDLVQRIVAPGKPLSLPVADVMTPHPAVVHDKDAIGNAVRRMEEGGYRHLPVVDAEGRPIGMLSVKRIVHYLVEHFPETVYNLPPDPDAVGQDREGA